MNGGLKFTVYVGAVLLFFAYLFWRADLIPDAVHPLIGYLDDSVVAVVILFLTKKLLKRWGLEA